MTRAAAGGGRRATGGSGSLSWSPLPGGFGAAASVDVPALSDAALAELLYTLYEQRFVVLRTGGLAKAELVAFARRIGEPIRLSGDARFPEIAPITNIGVDTVRSGQGAAHWHTDQSFKDTVASVTMLYSVAAPASGGETRFCDMAAAYDALPEARRRDIEDLVALHRHGVSVAAPAGDHTPLPPKGWDQRTTVRHPLVRRHPVTGRRTLYAITGTSQGIVGMAPDAGARLLRELCEHALQPQFVNQHRHRVHDLVLWDNPTTLHSATPSGAATGALDTRLIRRISLRGAPPVLAKVGRAGPGVTG